MQTLVIALGGNAIQQSGQKGTSEEQFANIDATAAQIAKLARDGYRLVVTHGNGPQAGALLIQQEATQGQVPMQSLAACGAMTQGQIGWMIQNRSAIPPRPGRPRHTRLQRRDPGPREHRRSGLPRSFEARRSVLHRGGSG